jgi:predicted transcriptional regulator
MKTCPTCHQRIVEKPALTTRVLALLASAERPLAPKDIRAELNSGEGTTYQTLRRLAERGAIRKATIHNVGTGWVLAEQGVSPQPESDPIELAEAKAEMEATIRDLAAYVDGVGQVSRSRAVEYLARMDYPEALAQDIIGLAITAGQVAIDGDSLVAP